ncbi:GH25 family lysozyme [Lactiplantibacillus daowaiensis]|uniref:GH25 family lysozyme n=1 Tax=Lactiplantibacillus daowaiensis TaxID=2559918 RepID=A0ABW1S2B1_9LACO|nr:GH25 family lysozyme [Lactiplantibacillus daowaiensis]
MRKGKLGRLIIAGISGLIALGISTSAFASATKVIDVSQYQGNINWAKTSKVTKMAIIRVQHGGETVDTKRNVNANGAAKYGVPFGQYAFAEFTSVKDAQKEARQFYSRSNAKAKFFVLDDEKHMSGVTAAAERKYANAWVAQMRKLTNKKLILYSGEWFASTVKFDQSQFDGVWIANYSAKPKLSADLWQYSSTGRVSGISGNVDLSKILDSSAVNSWLTPNSNSINSSVTSNTTTKYYHSVPTSKQVKTLKAVNGYQDVNFKTKTGTKYTKGTSLTVKSVKKSKGGAYRFVLSNGQYISAKKTLVVTQ